MDDIDKYENRLKFEHELINRRLTWLLTSQTILFAALAFYLDQDTLDHSKFLCSITFVLGLTISLSILVGVLMGLTAKVVLFLDYNKEHPINRRRLGVRNWISYIAFAPDIAIPLIFIWAWIKINLVGCQ